MRRTPSNPSELHRDYLQERSDELTPISELINSSHTNTKPHSKASLTNSGPICSTYSSKSSIKPIKRKNAVYPVNSTELSELVKAHCNENNFGDDEEDSEEPYRPAFYHKDVEQGQLRSKKVEATPKKIFPKFPQNFLPNSKAPRHLYNPYQPLINGQGYPEPPQIIDVDDEDDYDFNQASTVPYSNPEPQNFGLKRDAGYYNLAQTIENPENLSLQNQRKYSQDSNSSMSPSVHQRLDDLHNKLAKIDAKLKKRKKPTQRDESMEKLTKLLKQLDDESVKLTEEYSTPRIPPKLPKKFGQAPPRPEKTWKNGNFFENFSKNLEKNENFSVPLPQFIDESTNKAERTPSTISTDTSCSIEEKIEGNLIGGTSENLNNNFVIDILDETNGY